MRDKTIRRNSTFFDVLKLFVLIVYLLTSIKNENKGSSFIREKGPQAGRV